MYHFKSKSVIFTIIDIRKYTTFEKMWTLHGASAWS